MKSILVLALVFLSLVSVSQPDSQWKNYTNPWSVNKMEKNGDIIWSATSGGILKTNLVTRQQIIYTRAYANLPSNNIKSLTVDDNGKVWFVTDSKNTAVSVFDGWATNNSPTINCPIKPGSAYLINKANDGSIWVKAYDDSIYQYKSNNWNAYFVPKDSLYGNTYFTKMLIDNNDNIWLSSYRNLWKFDGTNWTDYAVSFPDSLFNTYSSFRDFEILSNGDIILMHRRYLMKYANDSWTIHEDSICSNIYPVDIYNCNDTMWLVYRKQIHNSSVFQGHLTTLINNVVTEEYSSDTTLFCYSKIISENNSVYINDGCYYSIKGGLFVYENSNIERISSVRFTIPSNGIDFVRITSDNKKYILSENKILISQNFLKWDSLLEFHSIFMPFTQSSIVDESPDTSLWIAGMDSIIRIKNNNVSSYSYTDYPGIIAIDVAPDGVIWTSSMYAQNGIRRFDGQNWAKINVPDSSVIFASLRFDDTGKLWLGSYGNGIYSYDNGVWNHFTNSWVMQGATISQILIGDKDDIWFASKGKGIIHKDSMGSWSTYNFHNSNLLSDTVYDMILDSEGKLFLATYKGINILNSNGTWEDITSLNSRLPYDEVTSLAFDTVGNLWIGTMGGGLAVYKENGLVVEVNSPSKFNNTSFNIYPNPSNGMFTIESSFKDISSLKIFDIQGKLVKKIPKNINNSTIIKIDLSNLGKGVYFVIINSGDNYYSRKVMVW